MRSLTEVLLLTQVKSLLCGNQLTTPTGATMHPDVGSRGPRPAGSTGVLEGTPQESRARPVTRLRVGEPIKIPTQTLGTEEPALLGQNQLELSPQTPGPWSWKPLKFFYFHFIIS